MHREFSRGNIATTLFCFVYLSDLSESNGIHLLIEILYLSIWSLGEFGRILKQVQVLGHLSRVCMMCTRFIPKWTCENPVNVSYFFNIIEVKYTDKTLTRGFACLDDFYHFTICRSENLVLSNELIKVELLPWKMTFRAALELTTLKRRAYTQNVSFPIPSRL